MFHFEISTTWSYQMKKILAFLVVFSINLGAALADNPGYEQKQIIDNSRVRVIQATWKPGAESPSAARTMDRVVKVVKGGTVERHFEDGSKKVVIFKTGDLLYQDSPEDKMAYSIKNTSKTTVIVNAVFLK